MAAIFGSIFAGGGYAAGNSHSFFLAQLLGGIAGLTGCIIGFFSREIRLLTGASMD